MDSFNKAQHHHLGIGGINCSCCNNMARKGHGKKDRQLNQLARARVKADARKIVNEEIAEIETYYSLELMDYLFCSCNFN
jgi:hypothetical protein